MRRGAVNFEAARYGSLQIRPRFPVSHPPPGNSTSITGGPFDESDFHSNMADSRSFLCRRYDVKCKTDMLSRGIHIEAGRLLSSVLNLDKSSDLSRDSSPAHLPGQTSPQIYSFTSIDEVGDGEIKKNFTQPPTF